MESRVNELSPVLVEVTVEVPWERVKKDLDSTYKIIGRTARIRGFRKGKVPTKVIKQLYAKQVHQDVSGALVEEGLRSAVMEHDIQIVAEPKVTPKDIKKDEPFSFTAEIEVRPTIEKVETNGLEVWRDLSAIDDEAIDNAIDRMRNEQADLVVPEPARASKAGDILTVDYVVSVDGEVREEMGAEARKIELGTDTLLEDFETAFTGQKVGDEPEFDVTFPEDHQNEELKGKTVHFAAKVVELQEKQLPELDDEFAKDCGDFDTLLELRLDIRKKYEEDATRRSEASMKDQVVDALIAQNEVPVPASMVAQQRQMMMYELYQMMQGFGGAIPGMFDGLDDRAERRVRAGILLSALAKQEQLNVTDEDIEEKLKQLAEASGKHIAKVRVEHSGEKREELESQVLEERLIEFLLNKATVHEGAPPTPEPAEAVASGEEE